MAAQNLTPKELRQNLMRILNYATKDNFKHLNQVKSIEINIALILKQLKTSITDPNLIKLFRKYERELGSFSFAPDQFKIELLNELYQTIKGLNLDTPPKPKTTALNQHGDFTPLFRTLIDLKLVTKPDGEKLALKGIITLMDLLYTIPKKYHDYTKLYALKSKYVGKEIQIYGYVISKREVTGKRRYMEVNLQTQSGDMKVILFNFRQLAFLYQVNNYALLRGKLGHNSFYGFHMIHPQVIKISDHGELKKYLGCVADYGECGLPAHKFRELIQKAVTSYADTIPDFLPFQFAKQHQFVSFGQNLKVLHKPDPSKEDMMQMDQWESPYHERLKFEEFFLLHLLHLMKRGETRGRQGMAIPIDFKSHQKFIQSLPFQLTEDQLKAISDIFEDLRGKYPANRLIQGDVGSGKTVVVLSAMLQTVRSGYQAIIMVPTEVLARQHYQTLKQFLKPFDVGVQLMISKMKKAQKDTVTLQMAHGAPQIYVGTHALIQKQVKFNNPGLVVIDEQHRFGVLQRKKLHDIAKGINMILLSATPIPRTLSLGLFGDLEITYIESMPRSRKQVQTKVVSEESLGRIFKFIKKELAAGRQAYVVFPLIDESETLNLKSLLTYYDEYSARYFFDFTTGILHGKMKTDEKDEMMVAFKKGDVNLLFSTTVIEVGIDVPNATVMVILNSERFGLSQLHQLRGRVGRGTEQSYCFLVSQKDDAKRLAVMAETTNGFEIAREDLKLRGPGDLYGVDQSGLPRFRFLDFYQDEALILAASQAAGGYFQNDPRFQKNPLLRQYIELLKKHSYWEIA